MAPNGRVSLVKAHKLTRHNTDSAEFSDNTSAVCSHPHLLVVKSGPFRQYSGLATEWTL
jgi:hypothetical protein